MILFPGDELHPDMIPVGDFQIMYRNETKEGQQVFIRRQNVTIKWPGGRTGPPQDSPKCGFHGELCLAPTEGGTTEVFFLPSFLDVIGLEKDAG